ncbi:MAG TPA: glycine zipper family protein [Pseudolabrys sp.]|nr:glycine zipper family protein [Pseudolabrys sp.]
MRYGTLSLGLIGLGSLVLAGCASTGPATPTFASMPGKGKSYEAFRRDDAYCQQTAQASINYQSPGEEANKAQVQSAAVGTALGALAGAAIGSASGNMGAGAAIGAGTGLAAGGVVGAGQAQQAGGSLQQRFDTTYAQCMTAKGNLMQGPPPPVVVAPAPVVVEEPVYGYPPPPPGPYYRRW